VPCVTAGSAREHTRNLTHLVSKYEKECSRIKRARNTVGEWAYEYLESTGEAANNYARDFELEHEPIGVEIALADLRAFVAAREARLANDPKRVARAAAREKARLEQEIIRDRLARERLAESIAKFRTGEPTYSMYALRHALLRVSADGLTVETSHGASVPVADAKRAVAFIATLKATGATYYATERFPIGDFTLNEVFANGDIRAGCHNIEWSEIEALGKTLGVIA
jgi:hypothetical protein